MESYIRRVRIGSQSLMRIKVKVKFHFRIQFDYQILTVKQILVTTHAHYTVMRTI